MLTLIWQTFLWLSNRCSSLPVKLLGNISDAAGYCISLIGSVTFPPLAEHNGSFKRFPSCWAQDLRVQTGCVLLCCLGYTRSARETNNNRDLQLWSSGINNWHFALYGMSAFACCTNATERLVTWPRGQSSTAAACLSHIFQTDAATVISCLGVVAFFKLGLLIWWINLALYMHLCVTVWIWVWSIVDTFINSHYMY